ncbi:uncharacterized protein LOC105926063 [Fundulus heteroclitus]|uniref:uncharacterized protein LOC105926063 n=1 Tax=Fundulus heteroclitus TaxID=8078 RepID=UPI00165CA56D|nr:uncharacterized protein LOC105926063 [Fundulus heteroclitus]
MFACETSAVMKSVGAEEELISNPNLNHKVELLTLVKVSQAKFFQYPKYTAVDCTLPELMEEEDQFAPEVEEELLVKDFQTSVKTSGSGELKAGEKTVGGAAASASCDSVDGLEPVSIKKKKADLKAVRKKFSGRKLKKEMLKLLKLKDKHKLAFVHQTVYNDGPVKMTKGSAQSGSLSLSYQSVLNLLFKGSREENTTFTVPEKSTFAFGLQEIMLEDDTMEIPFETWSHKKNFGVFTHDSLDPDLLQEAREGISMKETLLKPLTKLPLLARQDLLKKLQEVLDEEEALGLLEEALDQSSRDEYECSSSAAVSSFMNLLHEPKVSTKVMDAVHLLVSAMDALPQAKLRPLTSCGLETLAVLSQLVESLKDGDEVRLPASVPVPLQQDGELRWAADLLCSSEETLTELSDSWNRPPEVLLEVLALTVRGVHMLQAGC